MSATVRTSCTDFILAVALRVPPTTVNTWSASLNADNTYLSVSKNGVVVWNKVFYQPKGSSVTDANLNGDLLVIHSRGTEKGFVDVQGFLGSLT